MWRYESSKFLILTSKIHVKSETLALKKLCQLQKIGYFQILVFELKLKILGTLAYSAILGLFSGKKNKLEMKSETQFLRKKH